MEKPKSLAERIQIVVGLLTALGGLAKALHELYKALTAADLTALSLPYLALWCLVLIVGLWIAWPLFFKHSRLLRPGALRLDPSNREHLKGREDDIDRLSRLCREFPQVHLVGESGAGKSALVLAGLCRDLTAQNELLPLYLDIWGQDWEAGPRTALAGILWKSLSEDDKQALGLEAPPKPEEIVQLLGQLRSILGRMPLLVFDQLDDYQARHRDKFLSGSTWLSATELVEANRFWRDIKAQLQNGDIRCLFVTDAADGLEPFRFLTLKAYHLDRLQSDFVEPLLTELTTADDEARPIIQAPERGWNRLKQRLVRDLTQDGTVLPSQMRMAFDGLVTLKNALTIRAYERTDGVLGLEAQFVESHVTKAASHSKLAKTQVLNLLTHLVEGNKTVPRSTTYLTRAILTEGKPGEGSADPRIKTALDYLEQRGLVRIRIDPDSGQEVWLLYHDYLSRAVLGAERRVNRWFSLAHDAHRTFQEAGRNLWRRWRSLLSPWQQIILALQRIRGRFRYGPLRSYALLSLARLVPYPVIGLAAFLVWAEISADEEARQILNQIGLSESHDLSQTELDAFWRLATSRDAIRYHFLSEALESSGNAIKVNCRVDVVAQALTGLDPKRREKVIDDYLLPCIQRTDADREIYLACIKLGAALSVSNSEFFVLASDWLVLQVANVASSERDALSNLLQTVVRRLPNEAAEEAFGRIVDFMGETTSPHQLRPLAEALKAVPGQLPGEEAEVAFGRIVEVMRKTTFLISWRTWPRP